MSNKTYLLLLRGINVGGNKKVPMAELKKILTQIGYTDIKTVLASGNAVLDSQKKPDPSIIESAIEKHFGFTAACQIIDFELILKTIQEKLFNTPKTKDIRQNVTFLDKTYPTPIPPQDANFKIIAHKNNMLFTELDLTKASTIDVMQFLDKTFNKKVTTRTWKTIQRIATCR